MQGGNREPKVATYSTKGGRIVNRRLDENGTRKDNQLDLPFTTQIEVRQDDKTNCLTTVQKDNVLVKGMTWRKLTPLECERLQGLPDNYTNHVSKTQRYKMLGNGFNVPTIRHIIKDLPLHEFETILSCFDGYSGFQQAFNEELNREITMQVKKLVSDIIKISDDLEKKDTQLLYQEKIIDGLRSQVKTLNGIIEEKDELIDKWSKEENRWRKAYARDCYTQGWRYVFSEIPNDTEGQEFVDTCKKYLNRESYTLRVKGHQG